MFSTRFVTKEEREKIKENRDKEKEINNYQIEAVNRMKKPANDWKLKNYKDKW